MKNIIILLGFLLMFTGINTNLNAQNTNIQDSYYPEFEADPDMEMAKPEKNFSTKGIQYGGWITPVVIDQRADSAFTTSITTARLYLKSYLWNNSFIYIRGKDVFQKIITKDTGLDETDNLLVLDLGFISMSTSSGAFKLSLGRKYFMLGTGLVFNGRGDGAEVAVSGGPVDIKGFGAYTGLLHKENNPYSLSSKDIADGSKRIFAGGSLTVDFLNQSLYFLGMAQIDQGDELTGEKTRYQSQYYGGGVKGVLFTNLSYNGEFIYEMGKSYTSTLYEEESVKAYAGLFNLTYYIKASMKPVLTAQYAYGSGDKDRSDYRSPNGNISGNDTGFLHFGTYVGGYALRPVLANIHIIRGGFSVSPFASSDKYYLKRMSLIAKYSYYMKDKVKTGINQGDAPLEEKFIGQGCDVSLRWRIFSDFSAFVNYAIFLPGDAYQSSESNRKFFMGGLNISF